jgi:hypothetical protein
MSHLALSILLLTGVPPADAPAARPPRHPLPRGFPMVRPQSLLAPAERAAAPLSRDWLVGYWVYATYASPGTPAEAARACRADGETAILADGTYRMGGDGRGRWALDGARLTMRLEQEPAIAYMQVRLGDGGLSRIRKTGPDEIAVRWSGLPEARFVRCD